MVRWGWEQVKWFDVGASRAAGSVEVEGFGLSIVFSPADPALLIAGSRSPLRRRHGSGARPAVWRLGSHRVGGVVWSQSRASEGCIREWQQGRVLADTDAP
jgi:hypothetical protein